MGRFLQPRSARALVARASACVLLLALLPASGLADVRLTLKNGRVLEGTDVVFNHGKYVMTLADGDTLTVHGEQVASVELSGGDESAAGGEERPAGGDGSATDAPTIDAAAGIKTGTPRTVAGGAVERPRGPGEPPPAGATVAEPATLGGAPPPEGAAVQMAEPQQIVPPETAAPWEWRPHSDWIPEQPEWPRSDWPPPGGDDGRTPGTWVPGPSLVEGDGLLDAEPPRWVQGPFDYIWRPQDGFQKWHAGLRTRFGDAERPGWPARPQRTAAMTPAAALQNVTGGAPAPGAGERAPGDREVVGAAASQRGPLIGAASGPDARTGLASWYGDGYRGRPTASGAPYDPDAFTAAHAELPFGSLVLVTHQESGRSVVVEVNDRFAGGDGRVINLSQAAARELGILASGLAPVALHPIEPDAPVRSGGRRSAAPDSR